MVTLIGSLAAVLTTVCWLPQVLKTLRQGTAFDFAWPYLAMLTSGIAAWTIYGLLRHDPPIYLCNAISGLLVLVIVAVKVRSSRLVERDVEVLVVEGVEP